MPQLITPTTRLHSSWLKSRDEWGHSVNQDGAGLHPIDDVDSADGFSEWVQRLCRQADTSIPPDEGRVHATYWWVVEDNTCLGAISLRHDLNEFLLNAGGNVGYGIRPSARRRGLASWALRCVLPEAQALGLDRVLVTCDDDNIASARTIEHNGGFLDDIRDTELGRIRRYWIPIPAQRA